jgi:hypothetical protein
MDMHQLTTWKDAAVDAASCCWYATTVERKCVRGERSCKRGNLIFTVEVRIASMKGIVSAELNYYCESRISLG